jgi:hypothetical protein
MQHLCETATMMMTTTMCHFGIFYGRILMLLLAFSNYPSKVNKILLKCLFNVAFVEKKMRFFVHKKLNFNIFTSSLLYELPMHLTSPEILKVNFLLCA